MLEPLERRNLFLVPLDDQRRWYRYHHLFADVLRAHLLAEQPDQVAGLHRRASDWYDEAGEPEPAVRHALAAGDVERAAELVELRDPGAGRVRREAVFRGWADDLPDEVLRNRPVLAIGLVGGLMSSNEFDGVEERLQDIERQLALPEDEVVVVDRDELARIPASIEMYRAALALIAGDPAGDDRPRRARPRPGGGGRRPAAGGRVGAVGSGVLGHGRPRGRAPRLHGRHRRAAEGRPHRRRARHHASRSPTSS